MVRIVVALTLIFSFAAFTETLVVLDQNDIHISDQTNEATVYYNNVELNGEKSEPLSLKKFFAINAYIVCITLVLFGFTGAIADFLDICHTNEFKKTIITEGIFCAIIFTSINLKLLFSLI